MEPTRLGPGNRTCSVVVVAIVQSPQESASRQAETRTWFRESLARALESVSAADRIVLDTEDGAIVCLLGDPEDALRAANALRGRVMQAGASERLRLRMGIHLGPVRLLTDVSGQGDVVGDGITIARRVMRFAQPDQILASRAYHDVVLRLAPDQAPLFGPVDLHRDEHMREHEVYELRLAPEARASAAGTLAPAPLGDTPEPSSPRFDPALLERLVSALAREIGPVATLIVRRAAERASDERALGHLLAENVPQAGRAAFLAGLAAFLSAAPPPEPAAAAPGAAAVEATAPAEGPDIAPEVLARAERLLTRQIGPVARLLVAQAAKKAGSPRDLFERLSVHIDDPNRRIAFIAEADRD